MPSDEVMLAAGLDRAFLGLTREWSGHTRAVYDYDRCVKVFNVVGAYVGEATPLFVKRMKITMD
jgi:hypothetical protein